MRRHKSSLISCKKCKNRWILWRTHGNFKEWNIKLQWEIVLRFQSACIDSKFSFSMLSRDKRLPLDTLNTSGLQVNVFGNQFSTFDSLRDHPQGIHSGAPRRERGSVPQAALSGTLFARDDKQTRDQVIFHRKQCYGSKKWRWSIQWMT